MVKFAQLLSNAPAGLYLLIGDWRSRKIAALCRLKGRRLFRIDCSRVRDKRSLLAVAARSLRFPQTFGANWDAFADYLTDLAWAPGSGYVIVLGNVEAFAARAPRHFQTLLDVLEEAAFFWSAQGAPFHVLIATDAVDRSGALPVVKAP